MLCIFKYNINRNLLIKIFLFVLYYSMVMYFGIIVLMNKVMYQKVYKLKMYKNYWFQIKFSKLIFILGVRLGVFYKCRDNYL